MASATVDVDTSADGTLVIQPHGALDAADAVDLRRILIHVLRRLRPLRLVLDLHDVTALDPINLGTLAAACQLGDDHHVAVFLDHSTVPIAQQLSAAGVPLHRLRRVGATIRACAATPRRIGTDEPAP